MLFEEFYYVCLNQNYMDMKSIKISLLFSLIVAFGCSKSPEDACDCLKKAANTYMLQGVKASEFQLAAMCDEFKGQLEDKDKRQIVECIAEIKRHIEDKELFEDVEEVSFVELPQGELLMKEMKMAKGKYNDDESLAYFLAKRPIKGTIVVSSITDSPSKINWDNASENDPKNFLVKDGKIMVNGYVYDNNKIIMCYITLLIPEKERYKIIVAKDDIIVNEENEFDEDHTYYQLINYEGVLQDIVINKFDQIRPTFNVSKFDFVKPDQKKHKIMNDPKSRFSYLATPPSPAESDSEPVVEQSQDFLNDKEVYGIVIVEKAYFYSHSNVANLTKAYIVKGQEARIVRTTDKFYEVVFTNESGKAKEGFIKVEDLEKF